MKITVEIDVPDGEQCGDCKHWLNPVKNVSCYCPVFREFLRGWSRATSMKCDQRNLIKSGIVGGREKMAETKLKPCEVCGSDDLHTRYDPRYPLFIIDCQNCGSRFGYKYPKDKAIEMWNDWRTDMDDFIKTADNPCDEAILAIKAIRGRYVPIDEKFLDSFEITYDTWTLTIEALELYKIVKRPNPDDLTETAIAQLAYDIERINTLRGDEWDYEPGAEEMRKELSAKYGHAINALLDYNKTVTVTWEGDPDDCPSAICSGCDSDLAEYDWYDKLVFGPRNYCPYCGGRIVEEVVSDEVYDDEDEGYDEE